MKEKDALNLPDNLLYSSEHLWARQAGDLLEVGISDYGQDQLGGIVFVELPSQGNSYKAGEAFGSVESVKAVNDLFMPVAGEIVEANSALEDDPAKINASCYGDGWLVKIRPEDPQAVATLLNADAYRASL